MTARQTTQVHGLTVDTWYDRKGRNWVTQLLDCDGFQIGDAFTNGNQVTARHAHAAMVETAHDVADRRADAVWGLQHPAS